MKMKKISIVLFFSIVLGSVAFSQSVPKVEFKKNVHDFGTIKEEIGAVYQYGEKPVDHTACFRVVRLYYPELYERADIAR